MNIPEGYKLVPVEPTAEMIEAAFAGKIEAQSVQHQEASRKAMARDYAAIIAVAPQPATEPVSWGTPKTIAQLVAQLETMPQDMPVKSAYRITFPSGETKVAVNHLMTSYEIVGPRWLVGGREAGDGQQKVLMFWTKHDDRNPVDIELPDYNEQAMGCGLEDKGITDRYEACRYGFDQAVEMVASIIESHGPLFDLPDQSEIKMLRMLVESGEQVAEHLSKQIDIATIDRDAAFMRVERMTEALELVSTLRGTLETHGMLQKVEEALGRDEKAQEAQ